MFIIQLMLLMLSSIGIISCSPKDEAKPTKTHHVRILQETEPGVFQNRNINSELSIKDIIYFDSNTPTVFNYDPKFEDQNSLIMITSDCSQSQKSISHQSSFKSQKFYVYQVLPPEVLSDTLLKKLNWICSLKIDLRSAGEPSQVALFKSKKIISSEYKTEENILFASGSVPYTQTNLIESQFQNIYLSQMRLGDGIELICETFSSYLHKKDSRDLQLKDLLAAANIKSYMEYTLDPRLQKLKQSCVLRLSQTNRSYLSIPYTVFFNSPKPSFSCPIPTQKFRPSQLQHITTATFTNPYNFPITFALHLNAKALAQVKWQSGGNREHDGSLMTRDYHLPITINIRTEFQKQISPWTFIWLDAHQQVTVHIGIRPDRIHELADIQIHANQNFCKPYPADSMFETFENTENLNVYEDPN